MSFIGNLSLHEIGTFHKVIQDSLGIRSHKELFDWLHDEVQIFIPHDIMIIAWGDFYLGLVNMDVVSYMPGMRTTEMEQEELMPFLMGMFAMWVETSRAPMIYPIKEETFPFKAGAEATYLENSLTRMRSALVQGIKDERGRHDCLYIVLSISPDVEPRTVRAMETLLPFIDVALRQVVHLPTQYPDTPDIPASAPDSSTDKDNAVLALIRAEEDLGLSDREREIMIWVSMGKTNAEIGLILNISAFTVKNHLQRIFRKLDVLNRAQAVSLFERNGNQING